MTITQDDRGDYLVYLGELTENGFIGADGDKFIVRKKGKSRAIDITGLFDWTGNVCAFLDGTTDLTPTPVCWADNPGSPDMLVNYGDLFTMPDSGVCPEGYLLVTDALSCTYYQDTWMFTVEEFVQAIWGLDNNGMKHLQLHFYPNGTDHQDDEPDDPMS